MADPLVPSAPWYTPRAWGPALRRAFFGAAEVAPSSFVAGADFAPEVPAMRAFDPRLAMSSMGVFPWVFSCTEIVANDSASLPLRVSVGKGKQRKMLDDHPFLTLMKRPAPGMTGGWLRRQIMIDFQLTGTGFLLPTSTSPRKPPTYLYRMHPARTEIRPAENGIPYGYLYTGNGRPVEYAWDSVIYFRGQSWEDDTRSLYGQGLIRSLYSDLLTEQELAARSKTSASKGRPDGLVSPGDTNDQWTTPQVKEFRELLDKLMAASSGGLAVLGRQIKYEKLGWSAAELQTIEQRKFIGAAVSAVFGVPPVRLGLTESVNYATADQQMALYWGDTVRGRTAVLDETLSPWVSRAWPAYGEVDVWHDYRRVPALQAMETARLGRVKTYVELGMDANEALVYEGFDDAPTIEKPEPEPVIPPADAVPPVASPKATTEAADTIDGLLRLPPVRRLAPKAHAVLLAATGFSPDATIPPDERAATWERWKREVHDPDEAAIVPRAEAWLAYLRASIGARFQTMIDTTPAMKSGPVRRDFIDDIFAHLFDAAEDQDAGWSEFEAIFRDVYRSAFRRQAVLLDTPIEIDPTRMSREIDAQLGSLISNTYRDTQRDVRVIVLSGLDRGASMSEIQAEIQIATTFDAARSLGIARTEATRSREAGNLAAYDDSVARGANIEIEWFAAHDRATRPAHRAMDGMTVRPGMPFIVPIGLGIPAGDVGTQGLGPGQFPTASMCVNCRCTTIARRIRKGGA